MMFLRPLIAAIALTAAAPEPTPAPVQAPAPAAGTTLHIAKPALWKVSDADTTIWLFGTIHVLPEGYAWQNPVLREAFGQADTLVIETLLDKEPEKAGALLLKMGSSPGLPPLIERVAPDKRAALEAMLKRSPVPTSLLDRMETWTAALMLVGVTIGDLGMEAGHGVEDIVQKQFNDAKKPIEGLESPEQQLGFLDALPEPEQRKFLETLLEDPKTAKDDFAAMLAAWAKGDEAGIAATFDEDLEVSPALREALLVRRNIAWADSIQKMLADRPGKILIAVGAGHLAGPGSVRELLEKKGIKVERVQ